MYMYAPKTNEKQVMNLKERNGGYIREFRERREEWKSMSLYYNLKNKRIKETK